MSTRATRHRRHRQGALLVAVLVAAEGVVALAACSTSSPSADVTDATIESSAPDSANDARIVQPEAGRGDGGHCSEVTGPCDLVLQDCPDLAGQNQECVVSGTTTTTCQPVRSSQQLSIGRACCPGGPTNPCLPGLTCVGSACVDGGPPSGRCSPACCKGDDQACGRSDPEGIAGACDITLVDEDTQAPLHEVCTYRERCKPFKQEPCGPGEVCLVEDKAGTASCVSSFEKTDHQPCTFANECADGLVCIGGGDAGECRYVCLVPNSTHPFDASVEQGGAGRGGCPSGEACTLTKFADHPDWFGACAPKGGG